MQTQDISESPLNMVFFAYLGINGDSAEGTKKISPSAFVARIFSFWPFAKFGPKVSKITCLAIFLGSILWKNIFIYFGHATV